MYDDDDDEDLAPDDGEASTPAPPFTIPYIPTTPAATRGNGRQKQRNRGRATRLIVLVMLLCAMGLGGIVAATHVVVTSPPTAQGQTLGGIAQTTQPTATWAAPLPPPNFAQTPTANVTKPTVIVATATPSITLPKGITLGQLCQPITTPTATTASPTSTSLTPIAPTATPACKPCPFDYSTQPFTTNDIKTALDNAADTYHLPRRLLYATANIESLWHPYVVPCTYDIGLMQIKDAYWRWIDLIDVPQCGLTPQPYDPFTITGNALLGAKLLSWITCYFSYLGDTNGTASAPAPGTVAWYYTHAHLAFPDTTNATGQPNAASLCAASYHDPTHAALAALTATADRWSCPYTAKAGDNTLLDVVISTYNQGVGTTSAKGITNSDYVTIVERYILHFAQTYPQSQ